MKSWGQRIHVWNFVAALESQAVEREETLNQEVFP